MIHAKQLMNVYVMNEAANRWFLRGITTTEEDEGKGFFPGTEITVFVGEVEATKYTFILPVTF